jgi:hypothetical protein
MKSSLGHLSSEANWMISRRRHMATERKLPIRYYVYSITVDDLVRYIGKGKGLRLYSHMKEVRSRLNRDYRLQNIRSRLQQTTIVCPRGL